MTIDIFVDKWAMTKHSIFLLIALLWDDALVDKPGYSCCYLIMFMPETWWAPWTMILLDVAFSYQQTILCVVTNERTAYIIHIYQFFLRSLVVWCFAYKFWYMWRTIFHTQTICIYCWYVYTPSLSEHVQYGLSSLIFNCFVPIHCSILRQLVDC